MRLHELGPAPGSKKKRKRLGRGPGSGRGKTSGKGHKGLLARSGLKNQAGFEGGQTPLARRLPKRGFTNIFRIPYVIINLKALSAFKEGVTVSLDVMREAGLVKGRGSQVKILGDGELGYPLVVEAHKFSESARQKIEKVGGQVKVISRA
ncbi:50S ribosomal protein L15 [Candidatus Nitrospira salsa]|nr:MAG: 50S ribosomal protein L15 [Nitrospirales bacterium]